MLVHLSADVAAAMMIAAEPEVCSSYLLLALVASMVRAQTCESTPPHYHRYLTTYSCVRFLHMHTLTATLRHSQALHQPSSAPACFDMTACMCTQMLCYMVYVSLTIKLCVAQTHIMTATHLRVGSRGSLSWSFKLDCVLTKLVLSQHKYARALFTAVALQLYLS